LFFPDFTCASIIGETVGNIESKSPVRLPRNGTLASIKLTRASFDPSGLPKRRARSQRQSRYNSTVFVKGEDICTRDQIFDNFLIAFFSLSFEHFGVEPEQKRFAR